MTRRARWTYPSDMPASACNRIERTLAETETAAIEAGPPEPQMWIFGGRGSDRVSRARPPATDPVRVVLIVLESAVQEFRETAHDKKWPVEKLRSVVDDFLRWLTDRVYTQQSAPP